MEAWEPWESETVIVLEDSVSFALALAQTIEANSAFRVKMIQTFEELRVLLSSTETFFAAIADIHLPDSDGEAIDYLLDNEIPTIVLTGNENESIRDLYIEKPIVDYIFKDDNLSVSQIITQLKRLDENHQSKILIVDDSVLVRELLKKYLLCHRYQVLEAGNGKEALEVVSQNPTLKLVITDHEMPHMNGFDLIKVLREHFNKTQLPIIGMTATNDTSLAVEFLKRGANDFLYKPFHKEEFFCRMNLNLDILDYIQQIQQAAFTDFLTQLPNRKYFFDKGYPLYDQLKAQNKTMILCMMDIDYFKTINDTYGHDIGDHVLVSIGKLIREHIRKSDIIARLGGEEFALFFTQMDIRQALERLESIRKKIESSTLAEFEGKPIRATISLGATNKPHTTFDEMLKAADENLYKAKSNGRNKLVIS